MIGNIFVVDINEPYTFNITVNNSGNTYTFDETMDRENYIADNTTQPNITIYAGDSISFWNNASSHPFLIKDSNDDLVKTTRGESNGFVVESRTYQFNDIGTYKYVCSIHSSMTGDINVIAPQSKNFDYYLSRVAGGFTAWTINSSVIYPAIDRQHIFNKPTSDAFHQHIILI